MKAITTKYHGPTNTRGSRISADDGDGNKIFHPYNYDLSGVELHADAALALCAKMGWSGTLISGGTRDGYVFVFEESARFPIPNITSDVNSKRGVRN